MNSYIKAFIVKMLQDSVQPQKPFEACIVINTQLAKEIIRYKESAHMLQTTLEEIERTDIGTCEICSIGSTVFKLKGFTTSCDCTETICDWQELQPGDFYRTVEIYGNIPDNALQFSFIGTVIKTK